MNKISNYAVYEQNYICINRYYKSLTVSIFYIFIEFSDCLSSLNFFIGRKIKFEVIDEYKYLSADTWAQ